VIGGKPGWLPVRPLLVALALAMLGDLPGAQAHESRPGYLEIKETAPGRYDVLWRTPLYSGKRLPLALKFPDQARHVTPPKVQELPDSLIERRWIDSVPPGWPDNESSLLACRPPLSMARPRHESGWVAFDDAGAAVATMV